MAPALSHELVVDNIETWEYQPVNDGLGFTVWGFYQVWALNSIVDVDGENLASPSTWRSIVLITYLVTVDIT